MFPVIRYRSSWWREKLSNVEGSEVQWSEVKWMKQVKWNEAKWSAVQGRGVWVFMEKVYRNIKWWEVKDWGESVSELVTGGGDNNKKLYTVLSYLGVFTFYTCCKISNLSRVHCW